MHLPKGKDRLLRSQEKLGNKTDGQRESEAYLRRSFFEVFQNYKRISCMVNFLSDEMFAGVRLYQFFFSFPPKLITKLIIDARRVLYLLPCRGSSICAFVLSR